MTSFESSDSNALEVDGIIFETLVSQSILTVPERKCSAHTIVQLGIRISNNTQTPLCFAFYYSLFPELIALSGQIVERGFNSERLLKPIASDFLQAMPGKSVTFFRNAILHWTVNRKNKRDQKLTLTIPIRDGDCLSFSKLIPGKYQLRFKYTRLQKKDNYFSKYIDLNILSEVWEGEVMTPTVDIYLVQPRTEFG